MQQPRRTIADAVGEFGQQLKSFVRNRVRSTEDAEDIVQDIWVQLSALTDFESIENVGAWLYTTARNRIIDRFRKKQTELYEDFISEDESGEWGLADWFRSADALPDDHYMKKIFWNRLFEALEELPEKQRDVFVKHELDKLSLQDIADLTGENIKTIISRKRYAVLHLQERLRDLYIDFIQP